MQTEKGDEEDSGHNDILFFFVSGQVFQQNLYDESELIETPESPSYDDYGYLGELLSGRVTHSLNYNTLPHKK